MKTLNNEGATGDVVENKGRPSEVRGRKASAAGPPVLTPGSLFLSPVLQEMTVHPEILLKTKEDERKMRGKRCEGFILTWNSGQADQGRCGAKKLRSKPEYA